MAESENQPDSLGDDPSFDPASEPALSVGNPGKPVKSAKPVKPAKAKRVLSAKSLRLRAAAVSVLTAAMLASTMAAVYFYHYDLERFAGQQAERPVDIRMNWPVISAEGDGPRAGTTWLDRATQLELVALIKQKLSQNPLDLVSLRSTRQALLDTGWFTSINFVRRYQDGIVHIDAAWQQPVCAVRWLDRDYVVSSTGARMPLDFAPGKSGLPLLIGPVSPIPVSAGELWLGGDVQAGIALHGVIQQVESIAEQVRSVDVSRYQSEGKLALITNQGGRIVWGAAPGDFAPGERSPLVKLGWLLKLRQAAEYGYRIDAGRRKLDISLPVGVMAERSDASGGGAAGSEPGAMVSEPGDDDLPHSAFVRMGDHRFKASELIQMAGSLPPGVFTTAGPRRPEAGPHSPETPNSDDAQPPP